MANTLYKGKQTIQSPMPGSYGLSPLDFYIKCSRAIRNIEKVQCFFALVCQMNKYIFLDDFSGVEWRHHYMILVSSSGGEPSLER